MPFQSNPIAPLKTDLYQNATWSIDSQCPPFGETRYVELTKTLGSGINSVLLCAERVLLGSDGLRSLFLFPDCLCSKEYNVEKVITNFDISPSFDEPMSGAAQLVQAIFHGNVDQASSILKRNTFSFEKNLDSNFIANLALELGEFEILRQFLQSNYSMGSVLGLEYRSNQQTNEHIDKLADQSLDPFRQTGRTLSKCVKLAFKMKHKAALWVAILRGDVEQVKRIAKEAQIDLNASINSQNDTPLQLAIELGDRPMFAALMELKANPNTPGKDRRELLNIALDFQHLDMAKELVKEGASLANLNQFKFENSMRMETAYYYVIELGAKDGVDTVAYSRAKAAPSEPLSKVKDEVEDNLDGMLINSEGYFDLTLCDEKAEHIENFYREAVARGFLEKNFGRVRQFAQIASQRFPDFIEKNKLVYKALVQSDFETYKYIVDLAKLIIATKRGAQLRLLHQICSLDLSKLPSAVLDYKSKVEYLLSGPKLDINEQDDKGNTALHYVVELGKEDLFDRLLEMGAKIDIENHKHQKPLDLDSTKNQIFKKKIEEKNKQEEERIKNERIKQEKIKREKLIKHYATWSLGAAALTAALTLTVLYLRRKKTALDEQEIDLLSDVDFEDIYSDLLYGQEEPISLETEISGDLEPVSPLKASDSELIETSEAPLQGA